MTETTDLQKKPEFYERLKFRRQFIAGPEPCRPNNHWSAAVVSEHLVLSYHEDLNCEIVEDGGKKVILLGIAIDCESPFKSESDIASSLLKDFRSLTSLIEATKPLAGRWVVICKDADDKVYAFNDPCGLRQIYYHFEDNSTWFASQPTLINTVKDLTLSSDDSLHAFHQSKEYLDKQSSWIGNKTIWENCYHLMPNHYLDVINQTATRFFPGIINITKTDPNAFTDDASEWLRNIMNGLAHRYDLNIALTSGFDSRMLLAASSEIIDNVSFYIDDLGILKYHHDEMYIPVNLSKKLNLDLQVVKNHEDVPGWFKKLLSENVWNARISPMEPSIRPFYTWLVEGKDNTVFINGNVNEIIRIKEKKLKLYRLLEEGEIPVPEILNELCYYQAPFVQKEMDEWIQSIHLESESDVNLVDMYYWEQTMGNWMPLEPAEKEVTSEIISPFNCRLYLEAGMSIPLEKRSAPDYPFFTDLMKKLWPEVLSLPTNPGPKGLGLIKLKAKEILPNNMVKLLLKLIHR